MIGGLNNVQSNLSALYAANSNELSATFERIASGKKVGKPSDDYAGYLKAQTIQTDIDGYSEVKSRIADAKGYSSSAVNVGNTLVTALTNMKSLQTQWAAGDATTKTAIAAQFEAQRTIITTAISSSQYGSVKTYDSAALVHATTNLAPSGTANNMTQTYVIGAAATATGDILAAANFASGAAGINADATTNATFTLDQVLTVANNFLNKAKGFDTALTNASSFADNAIANKQAAKSAITDINDAEEMAKATDLQVRQQATVAMMAQANTTRQGIMKLYL